MWTTSRLRIAEFVLWSVVAAAVLVAASVLLGVATGGGLLTAKYALFVLGTLLVGVGSLAMRPSRPHRDEWLSLDTDSQTRLEAYVQRIPPLRDRGLRFRNRVGRAPKLLFTGLLLLAVSLFLEIGLGVAVG